MIRDLAGNEYKPEDYLAAFANFVEEKTSEIPAIEILLHHPKGWNPHVLAELLQKLKATDQSFTVENLQKAHEVRYQKALIDIISMVKHAVRDQEPLYNAEERVNRAFEKVTAERKYTEEQKKWLDRIQEHLKANLSIDMGDFEVVPIFTENGGWGHANHTFGHQLIQMLKDLNEAIAT